MNKMSLAENARLARETVDKIIQRQRQPLLPPKSAHRYHPFIEGLLQTLPATGQIWPARERAKWLEAAANFFDLIYADESSQKLGERLGSEKPASDNPNESLVGREGIEPPTRPL